MSPWEPEGEPHGKGTKPVTLPRPGHADLAGVLKYGHARSNAFERVVAVLEHSGKVSVARTRQRHRLRAFPVWLALRLPRAHPPRPVLVVEIADDEGERRAERQSLAQAGQHLDGVGLELLARTTSVAELPPPQVGIDRGAVEPKARGQAGEHGHERGSVRLSCGDEAECHAASLEGCVPVVRFLRARSEELDRIPGRILDHHLRAARPGDRIVPSGRPPLVQPCESLGNVVDHDHEPVPPPGSGARPSGIGRAAELCGPSARARGRHARRSRMPAPCS